MSRSFDPPPRPLAGRLLVAVRRHRTPLSVGAGLVAIAGATSGAILGFSGAPAQADVPAPSSGRLLTVRVETRTSPEPEPAIAYSLMPTVAPAQDYALVTDPDLASAQAADEVQRYLDAESREQAATLAAISRTDAQAARTMREAPAWPVQDPASTPAPAPGASQG